MWAVMWLPSCVPQASTVLSKLGVGVEPLFCLVFWDRGRACARRGRGTRLKQTPVPLITWTVNVLRKCLLKPNFFGALPSQQRTCHPTELPYPTPSPPPGGSNDPRPRGRNPPPLPLVVWIGVCKECRGLSLCIVLDHSWLRPQ